MPHRQAGRFRVYVQRSPGSTRLRFVLVSETQALAEPVAHGARRLFPQCLHFALCEQFG
jgi:hypothetical protein